MNLREAYTARAIGYSWDNYQKTLGLPPYLGRTKFGTMKKSGLDLRFIKGKGGLPVALRASAFDAQAPLRDGIGFQDIQNEMPFFREAIMVTEKEEQDYASFAESNEEMANQVLREIMKKPMDLIQGADVVPERMIWQLLAPADGIPKITFINPSKEVLTVDYTVDNGAEHKADHYFTPTVAWTTPATATPIEDLVTMKRTFAKKTGHQLARFAMNTETFELMLACDDTKKQVMGLTAFNGGLRLRREDVVAYLRSEGIVIEIYDKMYKDDFDAQAAYFIPTGVISAVPEGVKLGDFVYGTTPEERSGDKACGNLAIVNTGVAVYTYGTEHPVNTHCVVSMIGLPTFEGMDAVAVMKVN